MKRRLLRRRFGSFRKTPIALPKARNAIARFSMRSMWDFCVIEMLFDAQGQARDYRFLEVNPAFERHTGLVNGVGKTALEMVPDLNDFWFRTYGGGRTNGEGRAF